MKRVISMFVAIFLLVTALAGNVSAFTPAGLLQGVPGDLRGWTSGAPILQANVTEWTDNDNSTFLEIKDELNRHAEFILSTPATIDSLRIKMTGNTSAVSIQFYDSADNFLAYGGISNTSVYSDDMTGNLVSFTPVPNVKRILIFNMQTASMSLYEFDVYSGDSEEPEDPETVTRALLTLYLSNGQVKEYDLSSAQLDTFLTWYDDRADGTGPAKYAFTKTWNKGPFKTRTEYVIFDKIVNFDVDEYEVEEE